MPRPDDDALSWEGDDDPTLDTRVDAPADADPAPSAPVETPPATEPATEPEPAVTRPVAEEPAPGEEPVEGEPRRLGDAALVSLGVLGGVYLLWTVGWVLGSLRLRDWIQIRTGAVADAMFHGSMVLGILAPAIWFGAAWFLTRGRPTWVRIAAIVLGVIVLVPWPFVMVGVIGQ
ncbi:hypothetical protein [Microbacterium sediminis]|uniref:Uncharacterized protein n=1 Tax=Microbacterium sediminis TaxID=904291 RepID=A0A1B9NFG0_9MICO|nr:hypothetical protein [Microbacterium sediminis]OCG75338.1 hypothetical protein A7J15_02800 [Microbacterium sediminis]QBR74362.1 DNA polymerase III subunit gamma/tau [Microbacterium sediminis]